MPRVRPLKPAQRPFVSIPRVAFERMVRDIAAKCKPGLSFQPEAMDALQVDAEELLAEAFTRAHKLANRFSHKTVTEKHFRSLDAPDPVENVPACVVPEAGGAAEVLVAV